MHPRPFARFLQRSFQGLGSVISVTTVTHINESNPRVIYIIYRCLGKYNYRVVQTLQFRCTKVNMINFY